MHLLPREKYRFVKHIFKELEFNIVIDSVLCGNTHGLVYVDNLNNPETAVLWDKMGELIISGDSSKTGIMKDIDTLIYEFKEKAVKREIPSFDLYYSKSFTNKLNQIRIDQAKRPVQRIVFKFINLKINWHKSITPNCTIKRIDSKLLNDTSLEYIEHVKGWIHSFWKSENDFISKGIGFCLIENNTILSWCLSVFVSDNNFEFGLATVPYFRRKGYGKLAAAACMEYCLENAITPYWQCDKENIPSLRVSEAIGFEISFQYNILRISLT